MRSAPDEATLIVVDAVLFPLFGSFGYVADPETVNVEPVPATMLIVTVVDAPDPSALPVQVAVVPLGVQVRPEPDSDAIVAPLVVNDTVNAPVGSGPALLNVSV
jgi:hypothetical protein